MPKEITTKAIVLSESPMGDYDKRLVLLTKDQGKVTAFAKGCRRSNSKMLASTQTFAYSEFVLFQGRNAYTVKQVQLIEAFHSLRLDVEQLTYGLYMLEFVDYVAKDEMENLDLLQWLLKSLQNLCKNVIEYRVIMRIFELKAMDILGFTPWLNHCVACEDESLSYFSPSEGGVICARQHGIKDLIRMSEGTLHAMRFILSKPINEIYRFTLKENELIELEVILNRFVWENLNKKFKTLEFLKTI